MNETKLNISETKELITYLFNTGVASFEGFGMKLEFRPDRSSNPFEIEDKEERRRAVLEQFKKKDGEDESDLLWSSGS